MKSKVKPLFSIVTISYNQDTFLESCIRSVLNQSFNNFEYIIQDPGSTDDSRKILSSYKDIDSRLKVFFEDDDSPGDGLNKGFSKANGKYFLFLNSDDELCPDALKELSYIIKTNPRFDVYSGAAKIIDKNGKVLRYTYSDQMNLKRASYSSCIIVQQSTTFTSSIFNKVGGFNKENLISWDGELFIDFALASAKFKVFKTVIAKYRLTNKSITGSGLSLKNNYKNQKEIYFKINNKKTPIFFKFYQIFFRLQRKVLNIEDTLQRLFKGKISGRFKK